MTNPFSAETQYFYDLTHEDVLLAVEELNVKATGRIMPLNSMENRVFQVEIEQTKETNSPYENYRIAKFYRPGRWTEEQILEEHTLLSMLCKQDIQVVAPIAFPDQNTLQIIPEKNIYFCVTHKICGRNSSELALEKQKTIGRILARLHNCSSQYKDTVRPSLNPQTFGHENVAYISQSEFLPESSKTPYLHITSQLLKKAERLFKDIEIFRIHGDCHLGNVIWQNDMPTLLDFDDMIFGPAVQDLWLINPGRDDNSIKRRDALIEGYSELRSFNSDELALIEILRALRIIHFQAWIGRRWRDPAFSRVFPDYSTPKYWREEFAALNEINELIESY